MRGPTRGSSVDYAASSEGNTCPSDRAADERNRKEDFSLSYEAYERLYEVLREPPREDSSELRGS